MEHAVRKHEKFISSLQSHNWLWKCLTFSEQTFKMKDFGKSSVLKQNMRLRTPYMITSITGHSSALNLKLKGKI